MFNVSRPQPGPDCSRDYRSKEVVTALRTVFHGKCYLCEDEVSDPVVEHFVPHKGDAVKEHDWGNLYYACHRCNNIKGEREDPLLDCCDPTTGVFSAIKVLCPSVPGNDVTVQPQDHTEKTKNTVALLDRCYNENNTGIRGISREALHEKIFGCYSNFIKYRMTINNKDSIESEIKDAKAHLRNMIQVSYPFSVIWRWHVLSDKVLSGILSTGLGGIT
jgi:hypothetical protein